MCFVFDAYEFEMKFTVYDKAKWHYGAKNVPSDVTELQGGTHIAFYLRWCIEHDFCSEELLEDFDREIALIKQGKLSCREFFKSIDGVLSTDELNEEAVLFSNAYYTSGDTEFAKTHNWYLGDYTDFETSLFGSDHIDNAYLYIEDTEENYQRIKAIIEQRFLEFKSL